MSKFNKYLEMVSMSSEDQRIIKRNEAEIANLNRTGDDSVIKEEIRQLKTEIKVIKEKYKSDDRKSKEKISREKQSINAYEKRHVVRKTKEKEIVAKLKTLSDEELAREVIINIRNNKWLKNRSDNVIFKIRETFNISDSKSSIRSIFSLSEKRTVVGLSSKMKTNLLPKKLLEITRGYNLKNDELL